MVTTAKHLQALSKDINWDRLKNDYKALLFAVKTPINQEFKHQKRRLLMEGTTKVTKKKKAKETLVYIPNTKKAKAKKVKMNNEGNSKIDFSKKVKSLSKTKKCKTVKVDTIESDLQRRMKSFTAQKPYGKVYKKVSKNYILIPKETSHVTYKDYNQKTKKAKGYNYKSLKSSSKGGSYSTTKSAKGKTQKYYGGTKTKVSKSAKDEFRIICEDEDDSIPTAPPSYLPFPTQPPSATPTTGKSPVIASPTSAPTSGLPTVVNTLPTISTFPTMLPSVTNSDVPSMGPSISSVPTKTGTTKKPSSSPTISLTPSIEPSFSPSEEKTEMPSWNPSTTVLPSQSPTEDFYRYDAGNCPDPGATGLDCAPKELRKICDRYDENGSFEKCWEICKPSFCCIHDAENNYLAPSCSGDENCAQYAYCYIIWFHFHDTFGPATYLNIEKEGIDFFDVDNVRVQGIFKEGGTSEDAFFDQLYFHHFDNVALILSKGLGDDNKFDYPTVFEDPNNWQESEE